MASSPPGEDAVIFAASRDRHSARIYVTDVPI
jgi:hypothetical protein